MIKLLELREEKGLTQRELAKEMNVSQGTYNNWERGNTQPSIEQLIALAAFFDVSVDYLIGNARDYLSAEKSFLSKKELSLISSFRDLSEEAKNHLLGFLENIS